jgi:hypothetical protein
MLVTFNNVRRIKRPYIYCIRRKYLKENILKKIDVAGIEVG